jgi:outer membrane protein assembly factor BamB
MPVGEFTLKRATRAVLAVIIVAFSVPIFAGTATLNPSAPSWPKWRGPNGNGMIDEQAWNPASIDATRVLWSVKVGQGYSSACVVGGYVFTAGKPGAVQETLVCLDGATGATVWSFGYESGNVQYPGSRATPVFDNGKLYIMSLTGHAYCVDAQTGKKLWDMDIAGKTGAAMPSWGFAGSALIEGDLAMFNVCRSGAALDKETGKIVWKSADDAAGYATPVPFDYKGTRCLAVLGSKRLTVVEELTGREVASSPGSRAPM